MADIFDIAGRIHSTSSEKVVTTTDELFDSELSKKQDTINSELTSDVSDLKTAVGTGGSVDSRIEAAKEEILGDATTYTDLGKVEDSLEDAAYLGTDSGSAVIANFDPQSDTLWKKEQLLSTAQKNQVKANLGLDSDFEIVYSLYRALNQSDIVIGTLPVTGNTNTIYRVPGESSYTDWMYYNNSWIEMATYNNAIDDEPTAESNNLVKSGGVYAEINRLGQEIYNGVPQVMNLVDGEYVDTGGSFPTYKGWSRTDYLYIKGLTFLEYSGAGVSSQYNCFYDIDKHQISSFTIPSGSGQVAIPFGAAYCALSNTTSAMEGLTITNLPALPGIDAIQKDMVSSSAKIMQSNIVDSNNDGYYITPFIPFGGGNIVWHPSAINTNVRLYAYNSSFEQVNTWPANAESVTKNNLSSSYAYVRVEFAKNTRVGYLQLNKVIRWDNRTFDYYHYKPTSTYLQRANRLLDGYMYVGIIPNAAATPIIPVIPCYYIAFNNTYTNFLDENGNPIVVPYDGELYIIKSVFSSGSFSHWSKEAMNIPILSFQRVYDNIGYRYIGKATPNTIPQTPQLPVYYFAQEIGTYEHFLYQGGVPIVITDSSNITIIRSVFVSGIFSYWATERLEINVSDADIENAVLAYFDEHPASANQYVEFATGANAYAILGPSQDGADTRLCVGVGIANMSSNTGEKNIALGIENMTGATGNGNTAIGYHSLFRLTSGENNVGTGNEALDDNIEGSRNSGFGWGAAKRNTNGNDNVSIGYCALHGDYLDGSYQNRPSFHRNTALGSGAMRYVKTGSNDNVAIGYNATPEYNSSNQIVVGSGAIGEKANQVVLGNMSVSDMVVGNKRLSFNNDGTVSWTQLYGVTYLHSKVSYSTNVPFVDKDGEFECYIFVQEGYTLQTSSVKMGGVEISSTAFDASTGRIYIAQVTGTIRIEMRAS